MYHLNLICLSTIILTIELNNVFQRSYEEQVSVISPFQH